MFLSRVFHSLTDLVKGTPTSSSDGYPDTKGSWVTKKQTRQFGNIQVKGARPMAPSLETACELEGVIRLTNPATCEHLTPFDSTGFCWAVYVEDQSGLAEGAQSPAVWITDVGPDGTPPTSTDRALSIGPGPGEGCSGRKCSMPMHARRKDGSPRDSIMPTVGECKKGFPESCCGEGRGCPFATGSSGTPRKTAKIEFSDDQTRSGHKI